MGAAEVISFEEVRARQQWDTLRQQLQARFDPWRDTLEPQWHKPPSTLMEVSAMVGDWRQQLPGGLPETIVQYAHEGEGQRQQASCPRCARVLQAPEQVWRTVETLVGPVELERPSCYGRAWRAGRYPLDDALGLVAGCQQRAMHKAAANWVTAVPYATAQSLLPDLTGVPFGSERMHTVTHQVAEGLMVLDGAPAREEIERRIASVSTGRLRRPVMVVGVDGAAVPTRPDRAREPQKGPRRTRATRARWRGQWRDAKGFRFSLRDGARSVHGLSGPQVPNEEQRGEALKQVKEAGVIPEKQVRLCVVCEGAEWRWQHVQALCPQARPVLDSYHCAQDLHRVANAHDGASGQALAWGEATRTRLSLGTVSQSLGGLQRMPAQSDAAAKAMAHCGDDLDVHRGRTAYQKLRRGGSPLGSGGIESSNKCIGHVRLKRSGAWWYEANSHHLFAWRCAQYNGTLDQVFVQYQQRLRATSE